MEAFRLPVERVFDDSILETMGVPKKVLRMARKSMIGPAYHMVAVFDARERVSNMERFLMWDCN